MKLLVNIDDKIPEEFGLIRSCSVSVDTATSFSHG